jgi:hypothetical protein
MEYVKRNDNKSEQRKKSFKGVRKAKTSIKRKNKKLSVAKKKNKQK